MNAEPHTHELQCRKFGSSSLELTYGDTSELLCDAQTWSVRRIQRAARKLKRKHDRGSVTAQRNADTVSQAIKEARAVLAKVGWEGR